jgi:formate hydrogenlyase transcriptional activator
VFGTPGLATQSNETLESRYEALIRVSQAISVHRDPAELFPAIRKELRNVVKFDTIGVVQYDEAGNEIFWHLAEKCRPAGNYPTIPQEQTIPWWVFQNQQAIVIPSFERETRFPRAVDEIKACGVRSGCAFPLTTVHRRIGVLFLGSHEIDAYSENDFSFLSLVADQIALAVDDALNFAASGRAQENLQRERDRLKLLLELTNGLVSNLELRDLLRAIAASIRRVMQCDFVAVLLPDSQADSLRSFVVDSPESKGFILEEPQNEARKNSMPMDGTLPGMVFRTGMVWTGTEQDCVALGLTNDPGLAEGLKAGCLRRRRGR